MKNEACKSNYAWRSTGIVAQILECDPDELLAMAGCVPSDLVNIIRRHPVEISALLRSDNGLSPEDMDHFVGAGKAKASEANGAWPLRCR